MIYVIKIYQWSNPLFILISIKKFKQETPFLKTSWVSQTSGNIAHLWYSVIAKLFCQIGYRPRCFLQQNKLKSRNHFMLIFLGGLLLLYNSCQPLCSYKLDNFEVANYKLQVDKWRQQEQIRFVSHFIFGTFLFYRNMSAMCYWPAVSYNCPDERTDKVLSRRTSIRHRNLLGIKDEMGCSKISHQVPICKFITWGGGLPVPPNCST